MNRHGITTVKRLRKYIKLVRAEALVLGTASVGLGMVTGIFVYGNQQITHIIDPTPLQNFALNAGALTGPVICIIAVVLYFLTRKLLHHTGFHYRFYLVFSGITGMAIGAATWGIITVSAKSYGVVDSVTGLTAVIEAATFAIPTGLVGVVTGIFMSSIRGYNS